MADYDSNPPPPGGRGQTAPLAIAFALLVSACAGPSASTSAPAQGGRVEGRQGGTITFAVLNIVPTMAPMGTVSSLQGFFAVHTDGLVTSDEHSSQPIGRLAARVPSLDNGDIALPPNGGMRVVYPLRKGVSWHDGTPFTAQDLVFSYQLASAPDVTFGSTGSRGLMKRIQSVEAPDDYTFVVTFPTPYYLADQLGVTSLWPLPRHILGPAFENYLATKDVEALSNLPYWTSEYLQLGAFRLVSFDPGVRITLHAYDGYFLGRPKLDTIEVQMFTDGDALYASLLAGTVDLFVENTIAPGQGFALTDRWQESGAGTVHVVRGNARNVSPQLRLAYAAEPTVVLDVRVREALYYAIDREELSGALQAGHRELANYDLIGPDDPMYPAGGNIFRKFAYDPQRAQSLLAEAGWVRGPDGRLRNSSDGRAFHAAIIGTAGRDRTVEIGIVADYWRQIGVETAESIIPAGLTRDPEYRSTYSGFEVSNAGRPPDWGIGELQGPAASAANHWSGQRYGYEDPRADQLIDRYQSSLSLDARLLAVKAIADLALEQLPFLMTYYAAYQVGASKRVKALDDYDGGNNNLGTFTRNSYLWELR